MLSKVPEGMAKTVFLTSLFRGKTFVAANLAATFALSGKVLLIGMDIRNPTTGLFRYTRTWFYQLFIFKDLEMRTLSSTKDMMISTFCLQVSFHQTG
jgi:MinD superfamily P-loop ATPase